MGDPAYVKNGINLDLVTSKSFAHETFKNITDVRSIIHFRTLPMIINSIDQNSISSMIMVHHIYPLLIGTAQLSA